MKTWEFIEKTMYGSRPAKIYQNKNGRYKINFYYPISKKLMYTSYYKTIPNFVKAITV